MKKILIFLTFLTSLGFAQQDSSLVPFTRKTIVSKHLKEKREYWVRLPLGYNQKSSYPVIYILDAEWRFNIAQALETDLSENGKIPQHIVVGITHPNRRLDLSFSTSKVNHKGEIDTLAFTIENSGNGKHFLAYLEQELIPEINKNYRSNGYNILVGHSLGGYFCSYVLPEQKSFKSLQIYDPSIWYSNGEAIDQIDSHDLKIANCNVYLTASGNFQNKFDNHHQKIDSLVEVLKNQSKINIRYKCYTSENHNSMYLHSFLDGIKMVYEGYDFQTENRKPSNTSELIRFYGEFSKQMGHEFSPPVQHFREIGYQQFQKKNFEDCIVALENYLQIEKNDAFAQELLGDAYHFVGDTNKSKKAYKNAQKLAPNNQRLKVKLNKNTSND